MGASGRGAAAPPGRLSATARPDRSLPVLRRKRRRLFRACLTPIGAADADDLLRVLAEAKLGSGEQAVDDIVVAPALGRAAWRDRVCPDAELTVAAVAVTKQHAPNKTRLELQHSRIARGYVT